MLLHILWGLAITVLLVTIALKFYAVFIRNQALCKLPVSGSKNWILGGRAWYIISQLKRGRAGLQHIFNESVELGENLGPIYVG